MDTVKTHLHKLIDQSPDDEFLSLIESLFEERNRVGSIWGTLSENEKARVLAADHQVNEKEKLISHAEMIEKIKNG